MGDISSETSMEDILSSIKRIIAEEGESAVTQSAASRSRKSSRPAPEPRQPAPAPASRQYDEQDDGVLDLDGFPAPPPPVSAPAPMSSRARPEPAPAAPAPSDADIADDPHDSAAAHHAETAQRLEAILSERTAQVSSRSLESLAKLVVRPETPGSDTLEGLVREMLRPMLREWLDANLPSMVETMVAREISRITGSRD